MSMQDSYYGRNLVVLMREVLQVALRRCQVHTFVKVEMVEHEENLILKCYARAENEISDNRHYLT
jgi:hypothetical protein